MNTKEFTFRGRAIRLGDNIDTDAIIDSNFLTVSDEKVLASHCMEKLFPEFRTIAIQGDILVAGTNFGCGSSREQAPMSIKGCGIACVVAESFSRLFYRNAINIGLPVILCALPMVADREEIAVDCVTGQVQRLVSGETVCGISLSESMLDILRAGGLNGFLEKRLKAEGKL